MRFYKVTRYTNDDRPSYLATRDEAHDYAKAFDDAEERKTVRIELVEIPTGHADIVRYLNKDEPIDEQVLKTWRLTPRGGLHECLNGE